VDRKGSPRSFDQDAMRPDRIAPGQLLLPSGSRGCAPSRAHEARRRDLHRNALQRLQSDHPEIAQGRVCGQSQTNPGAYADTWTGRNAAWTKHLQKSSGTPQVPLSFARPPDSAAFGGVEFGYNIHSPARRLYLPRSRHRLVQPISSRISSLKQPGRCLLCGSLRGSYRVLRKADDFQYRPRRAVFFAPICQCRIEQRNPVQYGWTRASARQHLCGASVEIRKI